MKKVLRVTGGSRGIGAATCLLAAKQGYAVAVNYHTEKSRADDNVARIIALGGKGGVDSLTIGLGREVAAEGIRVVGVAPGLTATVLLERSRQEPGRIDRLAPTIPMQRGGTPEEGTPTILFAVSDTASYITATTISVSGGR